jgi:hypothetical protein
MLSNEWRSHPMQAKALLRAEQFENLNLIHKGKAKYSIV